MINLFVFFSLNSLIVCWDSHCALTRMHEVAASCKINVQNGQELKPIVFFSCSSQIMVYGYPPPPKRKKKKQENVFELFLRP